MEMIIGGAFQGKSTYAKEHHPDVCWKKGADLEKEELMNAEGVLDFQEYIKKELKADKDVVNCALAVVPVGPISNVTVSFS